MVRYSPTSNHQAPNQLTKRSVTKEECTRQRAGCQERSWIVGEALHAPQKQQRLTIISIINRCLWRGRYAPLLFPQVNKIRSNRSMGSAVDT